MFAEPEFWVAVAFVILMGVFAYAGVHKTVLKALDHRAERIKAELDDARRLKDEAAKVLADYKARRATAEAEAQEIVASAKAEAERKRAEYMTSQVWESTQDAMAVLDRDYRFQKVNPVYAGNWKLPAH